MRKHNIASVTMCIMSISLMLIIIPMSYHDGYNRAQQETEAKVQQLKKDQNAEVQGLQSELDNKDSELQEKDTQVTELKEKYKSLKEKYNTLDEKLEEIEGDLDLMSSFIIQGSDQEVSKEFADELSLFVWKLNKTYSEKYGFKDDPYLTLAFMMIESHFDPYAESYAEAKGITQLTDRTGSHYAEELGFTTYNPFDWKQNLAVGWYYFNINREEYGKNKAIVIYNQGYRNLSSAVNYSLARNDSYLSNILEAEQLFKSK